MGTTLKIFLGVAACLLLFIGYVVFGTSRSAEATQLSQKGPSAGEEEGQPSSDAVRVKVVMPKPGGIERQCTQPATVQSFEFVKMFAQVSGVLKNQNVDIKSRVKKGRVLAEINAPELVKEQLQASANLEKVNAQVEHALARLDTVDAEIKTCELMVQQRKSDIIAAKSYLKFRSKQLERYKKLFAKNAIEGWLVDEEMDRFDSAFARNETAVVAVETAKADVISKKAKMIEAKADLAVARANVKVAQALLEKAEVNVQFTKIAAPFAGVVTQRNFNNGDFIRDAERGGQVPLLVVNRTDLMRVIVQVPDKDAPFVKDGDLVYLKLPSLPGKVFPGKVSRYAESEDPATRTMRVEIDLPNPNGVLRDGMFGEATLHIHATLDKAFTIPSSCLLKQQSRDKRYVYVVQNNKVHRTPITIAYDNLERVEIISGLLANYLVVLEHNGPLSEGQEVEVISGNEK